MTSMWTLHRVAGWLAPISLLSLVLAAMALQDIHHGEADVQLEWAIVRTAFVVVTIFHVVAVRALRTR